MHCTADSPTSLHATLDKALNHSLDSILITRHDKIGDFVLTLPLCKAIKQQAPNIRLVVLVAPVNAAFAQSIPFIDQVVVWETDPKKTLTALRPLNISTSISCYIDNALGWVLWRAGIARRIAPATKFAQILFNERIKQRRSRVEKTEWAYNLDLGRAVFPDLNLELHPPILELDSGRFAKAPSHKRVAFHPGFGGSSDGNLSLNDYLALARAASRVPGTEVVFTFGPNDRQSHSWITAHLDFPAVIMDSPMPLIDFCRFLTTCDLFVSTSTGPMHLAGAVNTPTLSFFGTSRFASSQRWATIGESRRQINFMLEPQYDRATFDTIRTALVDALEKAGT